jgi:HCOMODA/2-hydroxy-3-carboxy-muconic semialdehyde decarboxylase
MENDIEQLKDKFVTACRIIANEGLIEASYSISCRFDQDQMMINDRISPLLLTQENIISVPLDSPGDTIGKHHPVIYKARKDVHAIVHAHPPHAIALGTVEEEFIPVHHYGSIFHGKIKIFKSQGMVQTKDRARTIAELLGTGRAILQRGHGTVVVGKDIKEAVLGTIYLEEAARINYLAKEMGRPEYFTTEQSDKISGQVFKERSIEKAWHHYAAKLK